MRPFEMKHLSELEKLSTQRLLAYYKKYRHLLNENSFWYYEEPTEADSKRKETKTYFSNIKTILEKREHVVKTNKRRKRNERLHR